MAKICWQHHRGQLILLGRLEPAEATGFRRFRHLDGVVWMNATAASVLELCDGSRTAGEIADHFLVTRNRDAVPFIHEFLGAALRSGWIAELPPVSAGSAPVV